MLMIKHLRFVFMAVMAMMVGNAMADEVKWDLSAASYAEASESQVTWNSDYATMVLTKETSSTKANNYLGGTNVHTRFYKNQKLTFTPASGYVISSIEITATETGNYVTNFTGATWENGAAAAEDKVITVTPSNGTQPVSCVFGAATRATEVKVKYSTNNDDRTATTIEFSGDYPTKFTCGKDGTSAALPTATVKAGDATVSGAAITWSIEKGSNWNTEVAVPTVSDNQITGIATSAYGELVVKASFAGDATYMASSKSYKFMVYKGFMTIEEMVYDAGSGNAKWTAGVPVSFFNVDDVSGGTPVARQPILVTYVNGSYTYVNDGDSDILLYGSSLGLKKGDKISGDLGNGQHGAIYGTLKCYNGLIELVTTKSEIEFKVVSSDNTVEAKTITVDKLADYMNAYVKIENAEYVSANNKNITFKVGDADLSVYNQWNVKIDGDNGLVDGEKYTLEGMGSIYVKNDATTYQLYLIGFEKTADEAGVNAIKAEMEQGKVYNLQGQRVLNAQKGLYIVGGKKVVLK